MTTRVHPPPPLTALVVPALAVVTLAVWFWVGMVGGDDLRYAAWAKSLFGADDPFLAVRLSVHQEGRIGATIPLAIALSVLGVSTFSLALIPVVATALSASMIAWVAGRSWGPRYGVVAGLAFAFNPQTIELSTQFVPEPLVTLEIVVAIALLQAALAADADGRTGLATTGRLALAGASIGAAYLATESGALVLPAMFAYLAFTRQLRAKHAWLAVGFGVVFVGELAWHAILHGTPLYRYSLTSEYTLDPMVMGANQNLAYRLFKAYPALFVYPSADLGLYGVVIIAGAAYGVARLRTTALFLCIAAVLLLFFNFMTASFTRYVALPVDARLIAPACALLTMVAATLIVDAWDATRRIRRSSARVFVQGTGIATAALILVVSFVAATITTQPGVTATIARNAESLSDSLRAIPAATFVADRVTARAIRFHRSFNPSDRFVGYDRAADPAGHDSLVNAGAQPVFVIVNHLLLNEAQLSGLEYGGGLSVTADDRAAIATLAPLEGTPVAHAAFERRQMPRLVRSFPALRALLGEYTYTVFTSLDTASAQTAGLRYYQLRPSQRTSGSDSIGSRTP